MLNVTTDSWYGTTEDIVVGCRCNFNILIDPNLSKYANFTTFENY